MNDKTKKRIIVGVAIFEALFLIFALVISIIVFTTIVPGEGYTDPEAWKQANLDKNGAFIGFLQNENMAFFGIFIIPTLVFIVVDFVYFAVIASKKESSLSDAELKAIKKQAEEEVRAEMLAQMKAELKAEQQPVEEEEKPAEEPKEEKKEKKPAAKKPKQPSKAKK